MAKLTDLDAGISTMQLHTEDRGLHPGPAKASSHLEV